MLAKEYYNLSIVSSVLKIFQTSGFNNFFNLILESYTKNNEIAKKETFLLFPQGQKKLSNQNLLCIKIYSALRNFKQ